MKTAKALLAALLAAALITALVGTGVLRRVDRWAQDALYQQPGVSNGNIVIIGIDETALDVFGPYNTWDRNIIASALEALAADPENKPAVTVVDVLFTGGSDPEADARLANAAASLGHVVTAAMAEFGEEISWDGFRAVSRNASAVISFLEPYEALRESAATGHINAMTDTDGVLRHALLYVEPEAGRRVSSMACEAARLYLEQRGESLELPPVNAAGHFYVPFTGKPGAYSDGVSIAMLIAGKIPSGYWADKIVLIGPYAAALQDSYFTSIDKGKQMYGVEFQANVIQSLLDREFKTEVSDTAQLAGLFVLCFVLAFLFLRLKIWISAAVCAGCIGLGIGGACLLYRQGYAAHVLWLPAAALALLLLAVAFHYWQAARERQALALVNERISTELSLATRIQTNSLPKTFPAFPGRKDFDIYASMKPAKEVGGDLYDFFLMDDDHLCLVIGDVSGKGVPAALFMMLSNTLIHHVAMHEKSPAAILAKVNGEICFRNPEEMFVTAWVGVLELSTGLLTAANAGHEYPAVKAPDGSFELFKDRHGLVLGGMEGVRYRDYTLQLQPGSVLFVYTDGLPEASDSREAFYGTDRMLEALRTAENGTPEEIVCAMNRSVAAFAGKAPQFDDLTMLCVRYDGPNR